METKAALDRLGRLWLIPECIGFLASCALFVWSAGAFFGIETLLSYVIGAILIGGLTLGTLAGASLSWRISVRYGRYPSFGDVLLTWLIALGLALVLGWFGGYAFLSFQKRIVGDGYYNDVGEQLVLIALYPIIMILVDIVALAVATILIIVNKPRSTRHVL